MKHRFSLTFITPCFCRGADSSDSGQPEIRPASIRGQLRWWFRLLGNSFADECEIFGSVKDGSRASKIVVRVDYDHLETASIATLPHKENSRNGFPSRKKAFVAGSGFELIVSSRYGGLNDNLAKKFDSALQAWLHLGALGLRCTRGAGNFTWEGQSADLEEYRKTVESFGLETFFLAKNYKTAEEARADICDTLSEGAFSDCGYPLGRIKPKRKTSPLRFRIVKLGVQCFRIVAIWDHREDVTENTEEQLFRAVEKLKHSKKPIGTQLYEAGCKM